MPGESGVTVVTMLVCFIYFAREAAGALSARHSPRPLFFLGERFMHNSGASRRGNVEFCREYERATLPVVIARLDPTICTHLYSYRLTTKTLSKKASLFNVGDHALRPTLSTPMVI